MSKLPDASRPAWEKRFGKPLDQTRLPAFPDDTPRLPDASHDAWCKRYGYKGSEIDRRFRHEKDD